MYGIGCKRTGDSRTGEIGMTTDGARVLLEAGNSTSFFMSWPSTLAGGEGVVPRVDVDKTGLVE
jgi:hypothetical protein